MNEKNKIGALAQVLAAAHQQCKKCEKQRKSLEEIRQMQRVLDQHNKEGML
ncbi:hypothetical protein RFF38_02540 [Pasteurella multocida]|uniref:hypothetical protein n=1 Tax=Pasteurella multocida TaxID=747 RepID=UPI002B4AA59A|nr:hypothetical protein [Pasteurella multocida]WRK07727.1 hypothetical protein RFF38_02540 [Pasteurella multocida]